MPASVDRGPQMLAIWWAMDGVALLFVLLRMYARVVVRRAAGLDDFIIVLASAFMVAGEVCLTLAVRHGTGRHIIYINPNEIVKLTKLTKATEIVTIVTPSLIKASVCVSTFRLTAITQRTVRTIIWINLGVLTITTVAAVIMASFQCVPSTSVPTSTSSGTCLNIHVIKGVYQGYSVIGTITDFISAALPTLIIHRLQMDRRTKTALCVLLGLGLFPGICSIMKTIHTKDILAEDVFWELHTMATWIGLEIHTGIIIASIPMVYSGAASLLAKFFERVSMWTALPTLHSGSRHTEGSLQPDGRAVAGSERYTELPDSELRTRDKV